MSVRQRRDIDQKAAGKKTGLFGTDKKKNESVKSIVSELKQVNPEVQPVKSIVTEVKPIVTEVEPVAVEAEPVAAEVESPAVDTESVAAETNEEISEQAEGTAGESVKRAEAEKKPTEKVKIPLFRKKHEPDEEDDEDIDFLDDPDEDEDEVDQKVDQEVEKILAEKAVRDERKKEKKELRRQKRKAFFAGFRNLTPKSIWEKRLDVKDFFLDQIDKIKNVKKGQSDERTENEDSLDLTARIKIEQNKNRIRAVAIGFLCVILIAGGAIYRHVRVFHTMKVLDVQERQDDNATEYVTLKSYRLKCNPNGVTCVNKRNEVVWNTTFTMQRPIVDKCDDIVAVGSQRGNEIYLFNEDGLVSNFTVDHVLTKMHVTKHGDVAAVLEDGQVTWINVYDKWGKLLIRNKTTMEESGYPLDMDISANGYKMMVSFLGVNDDIESRVAFFNFSAVGQDNEGKLVNEQRFSGNVIPQVKFMEGDYAIAFRDNGVTIFRGQQIPEECNSIWIEQEIISEFSNEKYFGIVTESDEEDREHKFKMVIYRENGSRCGSVYFNFEYTNIVMNDDQIILYNNTSMRIYSITGKLQFSGNYDKQILKVIPTSSSRKFNILTNDSVDLIKIK